MGDRSEKNQEDKNRKNRFLMLFINKKSRNIIFVLLMAMIITDAFLYFRQQNNNSTNQQSSNINEQEVIASSTPQSTSLNESTPTPTPTLTPTIKNTPTPIKNTIVPTMIPTPNPTATGIKEITVTSLEELVKNIAPNTKINIKGSDFKLVEFGDWRNMDVMYSKKSIAMHSINNLTICGDKNDPVDFSNGQLSFIDCNNINIKNINFYFDKSITSHVSTDPTPIHFYNCKNLNIGECNFSGDVNYFMILFGIENTKIYNCTYQDSNNLVCINMNGGKDITFENIDIHNCEDNDVFEISGSLNVNINNSKISDILLGKSITTVFNNLKSNINITNTSFLNNKNTYFSKYRDGITKKDCIFKDNIFKEGSYQNYDTPQ